MFWIMPSPARSLRLPACATASLSKFHLECGARFFCNAEAETKPCSVLSLPEQPTTLILTPHPHTQWLLKCNL
jgi:hypothetical protein